MDDIRTKVDSFLLKQKKKLMLQRVCKSKCTHRRNNVRKIGCVGRSLGKKSVLLWYCRSSPQSSKITSQEEGLSRWKNKALVYFPEIYSLRFLTPPRSYLPQVEPLLAISKICYIRWLNSSLYFQKQTL